VASDVKRLSTPASTQRPHDRSAFYTSSWDYIEPGAGTAGAARAVPGRDTWSNCPVILSPPTA